ncbi:phosphotransferase family protein [Gordonia sp. zg691]|uniref:phosphotransferase family protein n=1 Tax=Gordonia jinghuaiqii TaxID=2758710 RepID=UPI0016624490|nr:phosphotransferase family protein [Gordonia jinghuaiqii]MBD0859781.1 phosphotransferase family protein [Gordonia jinghuaiqii]
MIDSSTAERTRDLTGVTEAPGASLRDVVERFIRERLVDRRALSVSAPRRLGGGNSMENWAFDVGWDEGDGRRELPLLLRREPEMGVVDTSRDAEFRLLELLSDTDVPVARALWNDDGTTFGRPSMIVERRQGTAHRGVLRDADPLGLGESGRLGLAADFIDLLATVHAVDVDAMNVGAILPLPDPDPGRSQLDHWTTELDRVEREPQPALRFTARWLRDHLPPPPDRLALVHGDFRPANVLLHDGRIEVLLDWELAHVGDPVDDLGWYTCSIYTREHLLPGRWEVDEVLDRYRRKTGVDDIDLDRLHFWQVMSTFRLAVMALTGVAAFLDGGTDRPAAPPGRLTRQALLDTGLVTASVPRSAR